MNTKVSIVFSIIAAALCFKTGNSNPRSVRCYNAYSRKSADYSRKSMSSKHSMARRKHMSTS
ncbi:MAG: hypothetical protein WB988_01695, partial [Candidatus Nitrosopolaris sp.]